MDVKRSSRTLVLLFIIITLHTVVFTETAAEVANPSTPEICNRLSACEIKLGPKGELGPKGPAGSKGEKGDKGLSGDPGPTGADGAKGEKGQKGDRGEDGVKGERGPWGKAGTPGEKGDVGSTGPVGISGLDGVCYQKITVESDEDMDVSDSLCNILRDDNTTLDIISVYKKDEFKVKCNNETRRTHIIVKPKNITYIEDNAINYKHKTEPFWWSTLNSTEKKFNLQDFYNDVKLNQIAWMQTKTLQVSQTIRYHCKNSYVNDSPQTALRLMSWNDVPIEQSPSDRNPIHYSTYNHTCKSGAPKDKWLSTDIIVRGSTKRLPVIDFYVKDIRGEDQSFFLELIDLSFG